MFNNQLHEYDSNTLYSLLLFPTNDSCTSHRNDIVNCCTRLSSQRSWNIILNLTNNFRRFFLDFFPLITYHQEDFCYSRLIQTNDCDQLWSLNRIHYEQKVSPLLIKKFAFLTATKFLLPKNLQMLTTRHLLPPSLLNEQAIFKQISVNFQ